MNSELWIVLINAAIAVIKDCKANRQPPAEIAAQVLEPRGLALIRFERAVREASGLPRRAWRDQRNMLLAAAHGERRKMTMGDALALVDLADDAVDDGGETLAAAFPLRASAAEPAALTIPPLDIELVTSLAVAAEAVRKAVADLIARAREAGATIPGLG